MCSGCSGLAEYAKKHLNIAVAEAPADKVSHATGNFVAESSEYFYQAQRTNSEAAYTGTAPAQNHQC